MINKPDLKKLATRIDDMTLRERAMLFSAAALMLFALPYSFIIEPALRTQKVVLERINRDQSQINSVQAEIRAQLSSQSVDLGSEGRQKLTELTNRLTDIQKEIDSTQSHLVPAGRMGDVLRSLIAKSGPVQMVSLKALPGTPVNVETPPGPAAASGNAATAPQAQNPSADAQLFRKGVELTMTGSYFDLVKYLVALEKSPWRILWGKVELQVDSYPRVTMKVTLYTLGSERAAVTL